MNINEFSDGFDTLLSSYTNSVLLGEDFSKQNIVFDEYEKSVFLTKAQEEFVTGLYNGKLSGESFEGSEELRRYLSSLIKEALLDPITTSNGNPLGINSKSKFFTLPEDLWFITYEDARFCNCGCDHILDVYPTTQDEYHRIRKNPFRGANNHRALRLDLSDNNVEIVSKCNITNYYVRYLKKIKPIILINLPDGLTIEGYSNVQECTLHDKLHKSILDLAVRMALQSKGYNTNKENS